MKLLKVKELKGVREEMLPKQGHRCPLTLKKLTVDTACLDHDHTTGRVRECLARGANGIEGKVFNLLKRWGGCHTHTDMSAFLRRLADYWDKHRLPQNDYIHPSHGKKKRVVRRKKK